MGEQTSSQEPRPPVTTPSVSTDFSTYSDAPLASNGKPVATVDEIADYLTHGYWADTGRTARAFDLTTGDTITVKLTGLNDQGLATARAALASWTAVSGLQFKEVSDSAQITIDDNYSGAFASTSVLHGTVRSSYINVDDAWVKYGGYYLQTFIHEIGHALGLGHSGHYNGSASYDADALFANDSWQLSIMSYFSQTQNSEVDASHAYLATPQLADIVAIHNLYGVPTNVATGDTVYGDGNTTGIYGHDLSGKVAVALVDSGGTDLIDLSSHTTNDWLSLEAETFSDIGGKRGTFTIARGTVIENATTGSGHDRLTGNEVDNVLATGAGQDEIFAGAGKDVLIGGAGADTLTGGAGADMFVFRALEDGGDTITDFDASEGDRIDVIALLKSLGHLVADPFADGFLWLKEAEGGAWLYVQDVKLVFLQGVSATVDGLTLLLKEGLPAPAPEPDPVTEPIATEQDTRFAFDDADLTGALAITEQDGGTDVLDLSALTVAATVDLSGDTSQASLGTTPLTIHGAQEIEQLKLGARNDQGTGNGLDNLITGGKGHDTLEGLQGHDTLEGGSGYDTLRGQDGNDVLIGGSGDDLLAGGTGNDLLEGGAGYNRLYGGDGADTLMGGEDRDFLRGGDGDDLIKGQGGDDYIRGDTGNDTVYAGAGNDTIRNHGGADKIYGEDGDDDIYGFLSADTLYGGAGDDKIVALDGNDLIHGGDGADELLASYGHDSLFGGAGDDRLAGEHGKDRLQGGDGIDVLTGGYGADIFVFEKASEAGDTLTDFDRYGGDRLEVDALLAAMGSDLDTALSDGALSLQGDSGGAWLTFEQTSSTGDGGASSTLNIAYLEGVDDTAPLTADWFI